MANIDRIKEALMNSAKGQKRSPKEMLSSGLTTLNLLLSGTSLGAYPQGTIIHMAGDSDSGKTVLAMNALAQASINPAFDKYDLRFWNAEDGAQMDRNLFYGSRVEKRLIEEVPEYLDEFYMSLLDALAPGKKPFVGVVDSMDVLVPKAWEKKMAKDKKTLEGKETAGDFGTAKAKMNSEYLRKARSRCSKSGSILLLVSQVRDNINAGPFGEKRTISGGRAYKFYAAAQVMTSTRQTIMKSALGKQWPVGIQAQIDVKKNHVNGTKGKVLGTILNDVGVDDISSNIDYLVTMGHWKSTAKDEGKGKITCPEFSDKQMPREKLARLIEQNDGQKQLRQLVRKVFINLKEALSSNRKPQYD